MKFEELLSINKDLPVLELSQLSIHYPRKEDLQVQISRWCKAGKVLKIKNGVYVLSETYRKSPVFNYYLSSILINPSYLSLEKALEYYSLIPEAVNQYTSVTSKRMNTFSNSFGRFVYRHIKRELFWGYRSVTQSKQTAFIAEPEKALLDFLYYNTIDVSKDFFSEIRLQNLEQIDLEKLVEYSVRFGKPKILKQVDILIDYIRQELEGSKEL